jgi:hypothetical protein
MSIWLMYENKNTYFVISGDESKFINLSIY